jgi:lysophospholipase L1-like esterase
MPVPDVPSDDPAIVPAGTSNWGRHTDKVNNVINNQKIIFIGDSITQRWETTGSDAWNALKVKYGNKITNLGFDGEYTQQVIWRLLNGEFPVGINPEYVVLLIGTNNTRLYPPPKEDGFTPESTAAGIGRIIEIINTNSPAAKILLFGILPRGDNTDPADSKDDNADRTTRNKAVNDIIKGYAGFKNTQFYDMWEDFTGGNGEILPELYIPDDGRWYTHLSLDGYNVWKDVIFEIIGD